MQPNMLHERNINNENYLSGTIFSDVAFSYITNQKQKFRLVPRYLNTPAGNPFFQTPAFEIVTDSTTLPTFCLTFFNVYRC